jgi:hypothetical protein
MTLAPYIIVTATSLDHLAIEVQKKIELGYTPQGQPFNAGAYALPHVGISQAMVMPEATALNIARNAQRETAKKK